MKTKKNLSKRKCRVIHSKRYCVLKKCKRNNKCMYSKKVLKRSKTKNNKKMSKMRNKRKRMTKKRMVKKRKNTFNDIFNIFSSNYMKGGGS